MAAPGKTSSLPFVRRLMGSALVAVTLAVAGIAGGQQGIDRSVIPVAPDAPGRYVVQPGDTLWDISAKFLTDPWYWPEIWHINPQVANPHLIYPGDELVLTWVDGQPRVTVASGGPARLSPRVRENPLSEAIHAIPYDHVAAFLSRPSVLAKEQVDGAPYVARGRDDRLISSVGQAVYVRRFDDAQVGGRYSVYHVGDELRDDGDVIGYQGLYTGDADVHRTGDPATMMIVDSARETLEGDIVLPQAPETKLDFIPRAPKQQVDGKVISVIDDRTRVAQYDILVINRGNRDGLEPGNVLAVWTRGEQNVRDVTPRPESRSFDLPDERNGLAMVFKTYERMSYALMMQSDREIQVGDQVRSP